MCQKIICVCLLLAFTLTLFCGCEQEPTVNDESETSVQEQQTEPPVTPEGESEEPQQSEEETPPATQEGEGIEITDPPVEKAGEEQEPDWMNAYQPGSIELSDDFTPRKYRLCYYYNYFYMGFDTFLSLGVRYAESREEFWSWYDSYWEAHPNGEDEMFYKALVVRFEIPKEAFQDAIKYIREYAMLGSVDETKEIDELPNADIIYTFDDEIINHYYRYE